MDPLLGEPRASARVPRKRCSSVPLASSTRPPLARSLLACSPLARCSLALSALLALSASLARAGAQDVAGSWRCEAGEAWCAVDNATGTFSLSCDQAGHGMLSSGDALYLHGYFSFKIQAQPGYTGGTVTAMYLQDVASSSNRDPGHAEIDLELYGGEGGGEGAERNNSAVLATNVFVGGQQNLEQIRLPFDPAAAPHSYAVQWNAAFVAWYADGALLRVLRRDAAHPWPTVPMQVRASVWDSSWYTTLKTDFSAGPVTSRFQPEPATAGCAVGGGAPPPDGGCATWTNPSLAWNKPLTVSEQQALEALRDTNLVNSFGWDQA